VVTGFAGPIAISPLRHYSFASTRISIRDYSIFRLQENHTTMNPLRSVSGTIIAGFVLAIVIAVIM
jgi:hypothetical protein